MAQQRRRTNNSSSGRKPQTARRQNSGKAPSKRQPVQTADVTFADYWLAFSKSKFFFPVMTILIVLITVLIDLLVSWNNYDRFFLILGIELILVAAVWIIGLVLSLGKESASDEGGEQ